MGQDFSKLYGFVPPEISCEFERPAAGVKGCPIRQLEQHQMSNLRHFRFGQLLNTFNNDDVKKIVRSINVETASIGDSQLSEEPFIRLYKQTMESGNRSAKLMESLYPIRKIKTINLVDINGFGGLGVCSSRSLGSIDHSTLDLTIWRNRTGIHGDEFKTSSYGIVDGLNWNKPPAFKQKSAVLSRVPATSMNLIDSSWLMRENQIKESKLPESQKLQLRAQNDKSLAAEVRHISCLPDTFWSLMESNRKHKTNCQAQPPNDSPDQKDLKDLKGEPDSQTKTDLNSFPLLWISNWFGINVARGDFTRGFVTELIQKDLFIDVYIAPEMWVPGLMVAEHGHDRPDLAIAGLSGADVCRTAMATGDGRRECTMSLLRVKEKLWASLDMSDTVYPETEYKMINPDPFMYRSFKKTHPKLQCSMQLHFLKYIPTHSNINEILNSLLYYTDSITAVIDRTRFPPSNPVSAKISPSSHPGRGLLGVGERLQDFESRKRVADSKDDIRYPARYPAHGSTVSSPDHHRRKMDFMSNYFNRGAIHDLATAEPDLQGDWETDNLFDHRSREETHKSTAGLFDPDVPVETEVEPKFSNIGPDNYYYRDVMKRSSASRPRHFPRLSARPAMMD